ncbi:MAG: glycerol-3-phosphate 1-O-acyltransferase PlsY [Rhodocyclaceae bacterium]|mgnify:FL=1|nr:glycerol-3-phosphate 1-O-acyltransferase PlsY [Rhodocyclaceae bacterium]
MNTLQQALLFGLVGYLLGSIPFAVVVSKAFGLADPRSHGSGNPGATNVLRTGNKTAAILTLLGDALKGWFAVWLAARLGAGALAIAAAGTGAFLGHLLPLFLRFKGGKGVATALGVLAGYSGALALVAAGAWLLTALLTRYSSLSALVAAIAAPIASGFLIERIEIVTAVALMSALLIWRHRPNIQRLFAGSEPRIGGRARERA